MDNYITGAVIRRLREDRHLTQEELAEKIHVSGKAVSKWETGQGFPDISLIEPLAEARFKRARVTKLYAFCNRHGLFQLKTERRKRPRRIS